MLNIRRILLAQSVIIDKRTNLVTLCNMIEEFRASDVPTNINPTNLLIYFNKEDSNTSSKFPIKIVLSLNGKVLGENNPTIDFQGKMKHRLVVGYSIVSIEEFGILKFEIFSENKSLGIFECPIVQDASIK